MSSAAMDLDPEYRENKAKQGKAKASKGAKPKAKPAQVLQQNNSSNTAGDEGKEIEDIYQKKTQLEHILLRPDTYIGSTEKQQQKLWIQDGEALRLAEISYVPGLYKIFDEILVNAADNKVRDPTMDTLKVDIDKEKNLITIWNNGNGVPVEVHKDEGVYVPELIFGHLLTSSNYDDTQKKVTGGRNGYGAKLANIFSTMFCIETCDGKRQRRYKQVFTQNMSAKTEPKITACKPGDNWTCVSFQPDLEKFNMSELEDETVGLMHKRVYDLAGVLGKGVKVFLNGERLPIKSFSEYVDLYLGSKAIPRVREKVNDRWEVIIAASQGQFQQVSFVNSICTVKGGTHVNYVADQLTKGLVEIMSKSKEHKKANVKPFMVKNYLSVFVNCMIENPAFDSQTKETLTLRASSFGSKCELSDKFIKKVGTDCGLMELVASFADFKNNKELKKGDGAKRGRITGQTKLMDAHHAGGRGSEDCTLILTEGDSARSLVVSGLSVVGRDHYGVFPLKGKLLNVRDATTTQITQNEEIQSIKQIMGLKHGQKYDTLKDLRYGHLMVMTDQDHDGSHIKGLIMNYFAHFFPQLLQSPGFLLEFITPIVKATKGKQMRSFFTMPEYEHWCESTDISGWTIKYYKGLGTSTDQEAQEYFSNLDLHRKRFIWTGAEDGDSLELAFSKKRIEDRKAWLGGYVSGTFLDQSATDISYSDFVNKELILFSRADLERSIPCMVDGLKPGQRKILFSCFKKKLKNDIKVGQLSGYVAEHSAYHHGEVSLQNTIVGLAQNFVGSNNINLLVPSGQFGTRLQGGKDAASARYIFTRLEPITRTIFHEADDQLLEYLHEEGQSIEPQWYMPVLPMVLVNGAAGIGTGWSTYIPNFNPRDIVRNLRRLLSGEEPLPMHPWYRNFKGTIEEVSKRAAGKSYACSGLVEKTSANVISITELPIRKWTQEYKNHLETLIKPEESTTAPLLVDYREMHDGTNVHFELQTVQGAVPETETSQLLAKFKLTSQFALSNMVLFGPDGVIKRYASPEEILTEFFGLRMQIYVKRREWLIRTAEAELVRLRNQVRFILAVIEGEIVLGHKPKAEVEAKLIEQNYDRIAPGKKTGPIVAGAAAVEGVDEEESRATAQDTGSFSYLLNMSIHSLTSEKVESLQAEKAKQLAIVEETKNTPAELLYSRDLDAFIEALERFEQCEAERIEELRTRQRKAVASQQRRAPRKAGKKKGVSDDEDSDDDFAPTKAKAVARKPVSKASSASGPSSMATSASRAASSSREASVRQPKTAGVSSKVVTKPAASVPKAVSKQAGSSKAASKPAPAPLAREETSLLDRLTGRMGGLSVQPRPRPSPLSSASGKSDSAPKKLPATKPEAEAEPKPAARPPRKAAARKPIIVSSDSEENESIESSASEEEESVASSDSDSHTSLAKKRKDLPAKAGPAISAASRLQQVAEKGTEVDSPAVVPQGKVRRMRPSPFHKGSGQDKKKVPAAKAPAMECVSEDETKQERATQEATGLGARPSRRAAVAKKSYVEVLSSSQDEESGGEDGSDFEASE